MHMHLLGCVGVYNTMYVTEFEKTLRIVGLPKWKIHFYDTIL